MSRSASPFTGKRYGIVRVSRVWRIARPGVVAERLSSTRQGDIRVALKTPCRDGTTHVVFQPLDFLARLARWSRGRG